MSESVEIQRKRLRFRSWHRGTREMDLFLGGFADAHLDAMSAEQLGAYERLLAVSDPDLFDWITGKEEVPAPYRNDVMDLLKAFRPRHAFD